MRFIDHVLGIRKRWFAFGVGLTALLGTCLIVVVPTAAGKADSRSKQVTERVTSSTITEKSHDGFKVNVQVAQGQPTGYGGRYPTEVIINANKTSGHSTQQNQYTITKGVKFTGSSGLSTGHFQATFASGHGSINMTFHGSGSEFTIHTPKGCQGSGGKGRHGTLSGSFTIKAGGKLGTITIKKISATLSTATYTCSPPQVKGVSLEPPPSAKTVVLASKTTSGSVTEEISVTARGGGYVFLHNYIVKGAPSSDYTPSTDLSSGTLTGTSGISGTATFTGTHKEGKSKYVGTLSGTTFKVQMASIGVVTPLAKAQKGYLQARKS